MSLRRRETETIQYIKMPQDNVHRRTFISIILYIRILSHILIKFHFSFSCFRLCAASIFQHLMVFSTQELKCWNIDAAQIRKQENEKWKFINICIWGFQRRLTIYWLVEKSSRFQTRLYHGVRNGRQLFNTHKAWCIIQETPCTAFGRFFFRISAGMNAILTWRRSWFCSAFLCWERILKQVTAKYRQVQKTYHNIIYLHLQEN
jgi:hypothetical protein